jgi:hypothetical protein
MRERFVWDLAVCYKDMVGYRTLEMSNMVSFLPIAGRAGA